MIIKKENPMKNKFLMSLILVLTMSILQLNYLDAVQGKFSLDDPDAWSFSKLYSNLSFPEWAKFSNLSMPSTPQWISNFALPDLKLSTPEWISDYAPSVPTISSESFSELMPSQQTAIIGALSVGGLYGAYRYHKAYIKPTPELINDSIKFMEEIIQNPFSFHKQNIITSSEIEKLNRKLLEKESEVMRALGLTSSFLNPNSYLSLLFQKELATINTFFTLLNSFDYLTLDQLKRDPNNAVVRIVETYSLKIYFYLLQALNVYEPTTLNKLIKDINADNDYKPTFNLKNNSAIASYYKIQDALQNVINFKCQQCTLVTINRKIQNIDRLLQDIAYQLYGSRYLRIFLRSSKKQELQELNNLFTTLKEALVETGKRADAEQKVADSLTKITDRLPEADRWLIVEDYLSDTKESFYLQIARPQPMQQQRPQQNLGQQQGQQARQQQQQQQIININPILQQQQNPQALQRYTGPHDNQ